MKRYLDQVKRRVDDLKAKIIQIPRGENEQANRFAKATSADHMITHGNVLSFVQLSPPIDSDDVQEIGCESNWTTLPRQNEQTDRFAKAASADHMITHGNVLSFIQLSPLIDSDDVQEIGCESNWITPIASYMRNGVLPDEKEAARKLKV